MSEETHDVALRGPVAIRTAVLVSGTFGWLLTVCMCFCLTDFEGILNTPTGLPAAQIFLNAGGKTGGTTMWAFAILVQFFTGCSAMLADTVRAPDWDRMDRLREACRDLLPLAAGETASALQCLAAWVDWCRGRGSWAGAVVDQCRARDPYYSMAELLEQLLDQGHLAGWAAREEIAWRRRRPRRSFTSTTPKSELHIRHSLRIPSRHLLLVLPLHGLLPARWLSSKRP